ncbi:helix-turn-helix transcriptional regulator [Pseudomonas siliginis]|uniref:helix-turn-helix transcriptional regulator n=2 Tax=Pseudomonas TaxID=286 RepID=UPI00288AEE1D|nr:hypothetical protein [Pseudomonas koreensis]
MDLAMPTNWPESEIEKLVKCQLRICADLAISLAIQLNTTPEFWMNFQSTYDLRTAQLRHAGSKRLQHPRSPFPPWPRPGHPTLC